MYSRFLLLMQKNNVKAAEVSRRTGISKSTLSKWKNGVSTPKMDKLKIIADYFHVSVEWLAGYDNSNEPYEYQVTISFVDDVQHSL